MLNKNFFKKTVNELESAGTVQETIQPRVPDEMWMSCPSCKALILREDLQENQQVCPKCSFYFRLSARQRLRMVTDEGSFQEQDASLRSKNLLKFPEYDTKLKKAALESGEADSVVCGTARINGHACCVFVMESHFMMGSMGVVTGEKITRLFEYATDHQLPVVGFTVSGGARMQEGILSLMQMAKTSGAVKRHNDSRLLYVTVLTDPTTGGVTASFAMEGDIILAEPGALIGFAGPRVIEQTIKQKLPEGFQTAEFLLEKGFVDAIVSRKEMKDYLGFLLALHQDGSTQVMGQKTGLWEAAVQKVAAVAQKVVSSSSREDKQA